MPFIPPEQLARAREMYLLTYLRCCEPEELVNAGGNTYATRSHDSLKISNGKWYWWSRGVGGSNALDYLTTVRELPLPDAVQRVLSAAGAPLAEASRSKAHPTRTFSLPPKHADNRRVFSYLHGRGIDPEIINHCIKHGLLYETAQHHNCVFVNLDDTFHSPQAIFSSSAEPEVLFGALTKQNRRRVPHTLRLFIDLFEGVNQSYSASCSCITIASRSIRFASKMRTKDMLQMASSSTKP